MGVTKKADKVAPILAKQPAPRVDSTVDFEQQNREWRAKWEPLVDRSKWISSGTAERIVQQFPAPERPTSFMDRLVNPNPALEALKFEFMAGNILFKSQQKVRLKHLFDTIEKNPLTDEQIDACICMDNSVQIVAAAGSGKTSTMVAKAAYALHEGLTKGHQILVLAFNKDAANELRTRIQARLADFEGANDIKVETFHSFGLQVIAQATGKKPALARWVEHPGQDIAEIERIVEDLSAKDTEFRNDWNLFRLVYGRDIGRSGEKAEPDAYQNGRRGHRTANDEIVKSKEERLIADWLFYHSVPYEYERDYEHVTANEAARQYQPDFFYPQIKLYHEHFALGANGKAPPHFGPGYVKGVAWKRGLHAQMGTSLFETTSYEIAKGNALNKLHGELRKRGQAVSFNPARQAKGTQPVSNREIMNIVRIFQQHVKSNGLSPALLDKAALDQSHEGNAARVELFMKLYKRISGEWERRLKATNSIDFEDMLVQAAHHVESQAYRSPFNIVLADEFQDSSRARIRLLKGLLKSETDHVHLCVVGDDWQGINRFAGADISVMTEFDKQFSHATQLRLSTTFRCPQTLCDISSQFIQANPVQIKKSVKTTSTYANVSVLAFGFEDMSNASRHLAEQFDLMCRYIDAGRLKTSGGDRISVLLLGRYRNDAPHELKSWQSRYGEHLDISFKTVHSSKGLEADYVVILNVVEGFRGFPSQMEDDPLLQIPMPAPDPFPMAEERRLFYVAMTRAKRQVRIYTSLATPSRFVNELVTKSELKIEAVDGDVKEPCPKCDIGVLILRSSKYGEFLGCSRYPRCEFKRNCTTIGEA
ncbi:DNA helicase [Brucella sp. NBRC 12950]|nr:DNA helicase [Brucella sp. NBRC 12950]